MQLLEQHFDAAFDAPEGIKRLRELILTLAMQGKLVEQDSSDQPAIELLKELEADKRRLTTNGTIKFPKHLPLPNKDELPYCIPESWECVRNSTIFSLRKGKATQDLSDRPGGVPYLDIEALDRNNIRRYTNDISIPMSKRGDILVVCDGSRSGLVLDGKDGAVGSTLAVVDTLPVLRPFIKLIFKQGYGRWNSSMKGAAIPHLDTKTLLNEVVGLPPLPEQRRIVAKVEELMARCDELEGLRAKREKLRQRTYTASLNALLTAPEPDAFAHAWAFITEHFSDLHRVPKDVAELRKAVLQLCVMGKLMTQELSDPPASELLKNIQEEKNRLIVDGKIRAPKPLPAISEEEKPYPVPKGWAWVRLGNIVSLLGDGIHGTPEYSANGEYYFINGNNLSNGKIEIKHNTKRVSQAEYDKHYRNLNSRTVLVSINGTIGNVAFYNSEKVILGKSACYLNLCGLIDKRYVKIVFNSRHFLNYAMASATGTTIKNVSLRSMNEFLFPLPPLAEQSRIVAKVDKIMALCDSLDAAMTLQTGKQSDLLSAIMAAATPYSTALNRRATPARTLASSGTAVSGEGAVPKRRGRPPKKHVEQFEDGAPAVRRGPGRPRKVQAASVASIPTTSNEADTIRHLEALKIERAKGTRQVGLFDLED